MFFYAMKSDDQIIFATPSEDPLYNPDYIKITQEEYEVFTGEPYASPSSTEPDTNIYDLLAEAIRKGVNEV